MQRKHPRPVFIPEDLQYEHYFAQAVLLLLCGCVLAEKSELLVDADSLLSNIQSLSVYIHVRRPIDRHTGPLFLIPYPYSF